MAISVAAYSVKDTSQREGLPPQPTWLMIRRGLRQRRAMRLAQTSQLKTPPRSAVAAAATFSSADRFQLAMQRRELLARRRAVAAAAHSFAALAQLSTSQGYSARSSSLTQAGGDSAATVSQQIAEGEAAPNYGEAPESYLLGLLRTRGRSTTNVSSVQAGYTQKPTSKQVEDYDSKPFLSDLVRKGDLDGLQRAVEAGRGMDASNKFGESVVHLACRRGNMDILRFLLANGGSLACCDDLGRFPLHEVCWAVEPRFDIVRLFLDDDGRGGSKPTTEESDVAAGTPQKKDNNLLNPLLVTDKRGCSPLRYVKEASWPQWRTFLDEVVDEYWPSLV